MSAAADSDNDSYNDSGSYIDSSSSSMIVEPPATAITAAAQAAFFEDDACFDILAYCDLPTLAAASATCQRFKNVASSDCVWDQRLVEAYPSSGPLLPALYREKSVKEFYHRRVVDQRFTRPARKREAEEEWLRRQLAHTYIELQVEHQAKVVASRLVPVTEDATALALFKQAWVPLTVHRATKPQDFDPAEAPGTIRVTILRLAPTQETLVLATSAEHRELEEEEAEDEEGRVVNVETFFGDRNPWYRSASKIQVVYCVSFGLRQRTHKERGAWELAMRLKLDALFWCSHENEMAFDSMLDILRFVDLLLEYKTLWETF